MSKRPVIYILQANDASHHAVNLQEILLDLKKENRIEDYKFPDIDEELSLLKDQVMKEDLILILLTNELESRREQIENELRAFGANKPGIRIAEIVIDHVPYDNAFITFPVDLVPIGGREDMKEVWTGIEQNLKNMFPATKKQEHRDQPGNKRLEAVEKHPDYARLLKLKPSSAYLYGGYIFQVIFGFIFTFISIFFVTTPPDSDSLFDLVWIVGSLIFVVIGIGLIGHGIFRLFKLIFSSINRLPALIMDKRVSVRGGGQSSSARTNYYVTLEFSDGERREVQVRGKLYGEITKDDVGVAYIRDRYLLDYRRVV